MKTKTKAILLATLVLVLCAALIVGATFALFGAKWSKKITVTTGGVSIEASFGDTITLTSLENGVPNQKQEGTFALGGTATFENGDLSLKNIVAGDKAVVSLTIENTSDVEIKYALVAKNDGEGTVEGIVTTMQVGEDGESVTIGDETATPDWIELAKGAKVTVTISVGLPVTATQDGSTGGSSCTYSFTVYAGQSNASDAQLNEQFALGTAAEEGGN